MPRDIALELNLQSGGHNLALHGTNRDGRQGLKYYHCPLVNERDMDGRRYEGLLQRDDVFIVMIISWMKLDDTPRDNQHRGTFEREVAITVNKIY